MKSRKDCDIKRTFLYRLVFLSTSQFIVSQWTYTSEFFYPIKICKRDYCSLSHERSDSGFVPGSFMCLVDVIAFVSTRVRLVWSVKCAQYVVDSIHVQMGGPRSLPQHNRFDLERQSINHLALGKPNLFSLTIEYISRATLWRNLPFFSNNDFYKTELCWGCILKSSPEAWQTKFF